ncbi:LYR motif-containing protein 1 isoform X1 [Ailuropoda melanoleuca]|uniref:LYR motif-containing protein 1 isoform X1 n=1 Tax=Ailuropoda melanoleuca TaxID=9646 RepID=UPI001493EA8B|nr:LYR motif-containing protein 1 isoform X1 [Ailuropoda melanoleuca]
MLPQRSSRWFSPAWPTGPARPSSAAAQLSSRHRLLLARGRLRRFCGWGKAGLTPSLRMTTATRQEVLGLYRRIFRLARKWQAASGQMEDTIKEKQYILNEARTLFQKNKNLTDADLIKQCVDECTARIEIGLHYQIPYPRPIHLPPMGLTPLRGRGLRSQEKLRKLSKPVYLKSHDEIS